MSEADPAKHFEPVREPGQWHRMLSEAGQTFATTMVWTKDQEIVIHSRISLVSDSQSLITVACPKGFNPRSLIEFMATHGQTHAFFSVSLQRASIFFKCKFNGGDESGLTFEFPEMVYKVQRRSDLRFPIPYGHVLKVELRDPLFPDKTVTWKAADISAHGCALIIPDEEAPSYQVGLLLHHLRFSIQSRKIEVPAAEVRHRQVLSSASAGGKPGVKVGLLFKRIRETDSQHIAAYVFEENRRFFTQLT